MNIVGKAVSFRIWEYLDNHRKNEYALKSYLLRDGKTHPVAVICPGGGYRRICSFIEGRPYAKKLNAMGYHAFVVYYRVREKALFPAPQDDLARAVREILEHSQRWKLDMRGYSVWGSSAGGHLAACFGTESMGYAHYGLPKPGAIILTYPVITMGHKAHEGCRRFQLGPEPSQEQIRRLSMEQQVSPSYPPVFLWWGDADGSVDPDNSRMFRAALENNQIPCRCIEYSGVDHGIGIGTGLACEGWFENAVAFWEEHTGRGRNTGATRQQIRKELQWKRNT